MVGAYNMNFQKVLWFTACILLIVSCVPNNTSTFPPANQTIVIQPTVVQPEFSTLPPGQGNYCDRPYSKTSLWNVPLDWKKAKYHPNSDDMIAAFFKNNSWVGSDSSQYAPNVYFVTNETPLVSVVLWPDRSFRDATDDITIQVGEQGAIVWLPLPQDATPAPGTDGELAVINLDNGQEWGIINGSTRKSSS